MTLIRHMQTFHVRDIKDEWRKCPKCKQYFPENVSLRVHKMKCQGKMKAEKEKRLTKYKMAAKGNRVCEFCNEIFPTYFLRLTHAWAEHSSLLEDNWHPCQFCWKFYPNKATLSHHLNNDKHEGNNKEFDRNSKTNDETDVIVVDISESTVSTNDNASAVESSISTWLEDFLSNDNGLPQQHASNISENEIKTPEYDIDLDCLVDYNLPWLLGKEEHTKQLWYFEGSCIAM